MKDIRSILVVLDKPKHAQTALERARKLAQAAGAHMHMVSFCWLAMAEHESVFDTHQRRALKQGVIHEREAWLRNLVLDAGLSAADLSTEVVWTADIAGWVAEHAQRENVGLVVKSIRHRSGTLLRKPIDWQMLRSCPAPLLLTDSRERIRTGKVLATIDLRHADDAHQSMNRQVLAAAQTMTRLLDGELASTHVVESVHLPPGVDIMAQGQLVEQARARLTELLEATVSTDDLAQSALHVVVGTVGSALNELVEREGIELVVVGTSARRGLGGAVLGNTAERILSKVDSDLLAVHP
ncbi:MAG: hypothetical protein EA417_19095 [Gammaproteobacteria bacterium]|nr:MAG: hypothetical protein EA417_19095 [Gammaproteobacteria bacterium]